MAGFISIKPSQLVIRISLITIFLLMCSVLGLPSTSVRQPHIIIILADDLGWNDVGFHGSNEVRTPNIDALAYNGLILQRHYSMATCTPSRTALLTGRYPIRTGMQGMPLGAGMVLGIPSNETLLPRYLKRLGYSTSLVGKWHVGYYSKEQLPTNRGFDTHFGYYNGYIGYFDGMYIDSITGGLDARRNEKPAWNEFVGKYATDVFTQEAVNIIESHNKSTPLFLELSHLAPHAGNIGGRLQVPAVDDNEKEFSYINDYERRLFAGMVKELDKSVGLIVTALDHAHMLDDSIIVFISDNGAPTVEPFWQTGNTGSNWPLRGEKVSLHEGGIRTVGALWSSRLARSSSIYNEYFHLVDWLPTLYSAAGGNIEDLVGIDGINHWDSMVGLNSTGSRDKKEKSIKNTQSNRTLLLNIDDVDGVAALIHGKWKLIKNNATSRFAFANNYYGSKGSGPDIPDYNMSAVIESPTGRLLRNINPSLYVATEESFQNLRNQSTVVCVGYDNKIDHDGCYNKACLFDLENDPCETENLAKNFPEQTEVMNKMIDQFRSQVRPRGSYTFDPRSHPTFFNNYWSVWIHPVNKTTSIHFDPLQSYLAVVFCLLSLFGFR